MQMPEMAKKTAAIMALRQIHQLRFTADDIKAALPILKQMRDAEKTLESQSNEALDEEKKALLAARPDEPAPPGSGDKMEAAHRKFGEAHQKGWEALHRAIGDEKAGGLQGILGGGMMGPQGFPPGAGFGPGGPGGPQPGQPRPGPGARNFAPQGEFGAQGDPELPGIPAPQSSQLPNPGAFAPPQGVRSPAVEAPAFPGDGENLQVPAPPNRYNRQKQFAPGGPQGQRPGQQRFRGNDPFGGPMPGRPFNMPHISLAELIDLLTQKQAAMGK